MKSKGAPQKEQSIFKAGNFQYDRMALLGQGGFASVYQGTNMETGQSVAVKVIDLQKNQNAKFIKLLSDEIAVMKKFKQEHLVKFYNSYRIGDEMVIVMEFCQGGDLREFLDKQRYLVEKEAVEIIKQVMIGLKVLVDSNYIHRDIKPQNVLISKGVFKVADFGLAVQIDVAGNQFLSDQVGTPLYMSPQILKKSQYTAKSDIWSIGMLFYEMIFGKTPWPCRDINSFLANIQQKCLKFPYEKPIHATTQSFLKSCLQVEQDQRLGWEQAFSHPVLNEKFEKLEAPIIQLDREAKSIIKMIQDYVHYKNLDIQRVFERFDKEKDGFLSVDEFYEFLKFIDSRINQKQSTLIYRMLDVTNTGKIDEKYFNLVFNVYDFNDLEDRAGTIIREIKDIIFSNPTIKLEELFKSIDENGEGVLSFVQFEKFIKMFAPAISNFELREIFQKFDADNSDFISRNEFFDIFNDGLNITDQTNEKYRKAQSSYEFVVQNIKYHRIDPVVFFQNFDQNQDDHIDSDEFNEILRIFQPELGKQESLQIFQQLETQQKGLLSLGEFVHLLK